MAWVIIVESPTKSKTIEKYLKKANIDAKVMASFGHIRDLLPKEGAIDLSKDFELVYEVIEKNKKHVEAIKQAVKKTDTVLLAMDPDREGEAIAFHLKTILEEAGLLKNKTCRRIVFHEITQKAVVESIQNPRDLCMPLVQAQQARRALDYLVGFKLSPLLWKKIRARLSAGRVQSPALRLLATREAEIAQFKPEEYWQIMAHCSKDNVKFEAKLAIYDGEKLKPHAIQNGDQAHQMIEHLKATFSNSLPVFDLIKKVRKKNPPAPFTTSTLQQEASKRIGFSAQKTMKVAQQLYEGVETSEGFLGLISYMRTDSVTLSQEALQETRDWIQQKMGEDFLPETPQIYKTKTKNAQEAHEAIRPTAVRLEPAQLKKELSLDQYKLYDLIWKRTVACQMKPAELDSVQLLLGEAERFVFRASGSTVKYPGFLAVYDQLKEDAEEDEDKSLPEIKKGEVLNNIFEATQHYTEAPARYNEASLVKTLEEYGIGRPSTYASILSTLQQRGYATLEKKRFFATDIGCIVAKFLSDYFTQYVDYTFTAHLEDDLDAISRDEKTYLEIMKAFWGPFKERLDSVTETVKRSDVTQEKLTEQCPECEKPLSIRLGKNGRFIGCTGYPECKYTRPLEEKGSEKPETVIVDKTCPTCGSPLCQKVGKYGPFLGCTGYPKCKHIESLTPIVSTQVTCPACHKAELISKKSRYGKLFYACQSYPTCQYATWNLPLSEPCPQCHWPILTLKETKRKGKEKVCPQKNCGYTAPY